MLELPFLYIYPAIFPQQTLKTDEMVKSATLLSLSSRDKTARTSFVSAFVAQLIDQVMHHYSGQGRI